MDFKTIFHSLRIVILLVLLSVILTILLQRWKVTQLFNKFVADFQLPPGIKSYYLIGHTISFLTGEGITKLLKSYTQSIGIAYLGLRVCFFLNDAELAEELLTNDLCLDKPEYMDNFTFVKGGIFLAKGNQWKKQRKFINHAFNPHIINFYANKFPHHDYQFAQQLKLKVGMVFDILPIAKQCAFYKFYDCAFGLNPSDRYDEYFDALNTMLQCAIDRIRSPSFLHIFYKSRKVMQENTRILQGISKQILDKRRLDRANHVMAKDEESQRNLIFLDYLLDATNTDNKQLTNHEIIAETTTFITAATETCAVTISFLLLLLALHPEIQDNIHKEITEVIGNRTFDQMDVPKLTHLQSAIKETLRMFPVGSMLIRTTRSDVQIGDYVFPKDSLMHVNVLNIHYSEKYYPNPNEFLPQRFLSDSEDTKHRHRYAYLPFAGGKRNCIGDRFANLSLMSTAVHLLKEFRFETTLNGIADIKLDQGLALHSIEGYPLRIYPRM